MFGIVSRFLGQFWEGLLPEENKNTEAKEKKELLAAGTKEHCLTKSENLRKCFSGKVTKLYDDSGMIDEEVFFKFEDVIGGIRPKLNTEVHVEARRESLEDAWRADRVEVLITDWNSFGEEGTLEVLIGEVTETTGDNFIVNYDTFCNLSCVTVGYVVCKGDWVRVELIRERGVVCEIKSVGPLREKTITGSITSVNQGHGYINTDIFFSIGACQRNYVPRKGHNVLVTAIESNQGNCKWRALRIEPRIPNKGQRDLTRTGPLLESKFIKELVCDKQGVMITDEVNFGDVTIGEVQEKVVCIRNGGESMVVLKSVDGFTDDSVFSIELTEKLNLVGKQALDIHISPQSILQLKTKVNSRLLGEMSQLVVFNFGVFQIGRYFVVNVQDVQQRFLNAKTPFHKRKFVDQKNALMKVVNMRNGQQWVIPGERPMFKQTTINFSSKLKHYEIPMTLRQYILDKLDLCCHVPSLIEPLSTRNYKEKFSAFLHAEEVQMELEMREFDLEQVSLKTVGDFLGLSVPGLAEGRPSLLIGDRVILSVCGGSRNTPKYEGFIHEVLNEEILLKFHDDFHITYDMDSYDVMFFFNRTPLRRAHKAVEMANYIGDQVLFPTCVIPVLPQTLRRVSPKKELYNPKLNERQKSAVARILSGQCRPMPYVVFGPPGTGKTVTLVEAILQVFHCVGFSRILACTPSNSAADLIAERLHHSGGIADGDMVRLNAFQRQQNIPEDIGNYSTSIEKLDMASHYRIVICTCTTAGQLHTLGLPPGHFTHVFIDEAGQATEPESLVPISVLAGTQGQIILGGDPYQLGPVLRSTISKSYGLDISLLERLMMRTPYLRNEKTFLDHGCYDALAVTKLVCNYRCHEALLELPSRLFYHAEMVSCVDETVKNCLCDWQSLPNKNGFPIIFHGVKGVDLREGNSPSWFNAVEAVQVIRYVQELRSFQKHPVKLDEIGIITPYRKQVEKIRLLLDRLGMNDIKVGSVEEFQGQERLVIIISTVRSSYSFLGFDLSHNLGFLSNPKRFNVAITRAQALMIIVGNPHVLCKDTNWCALLQYCLDNNGYIGCDLPVLDNGTDGINEMDGDMDGDMDEGNGGIDGEENGENIDEQTHNLRSDVIGDARDLKEIQGSCRAQRGIDCSRVVKTGSEFNDQKSSASRTLCKMTGDNMNTEGEYVTSGGLPGDTMNTEGEYVTSGGLPGDTMNTEGEYVRSDGLPGDNVNTEGEYVTSDGLPGDNTNTEGEYVTSGRLPGDNMNTEGEYVTSGGLPGDTMNTEGEYVRSDGLPGDNVNTEGEYVTSDGLPGDNTNTEGEYVTSGRLPGDNMNTEGEYVTSGGLRGDTMNTEGEYVTSGGLRGDTMNTEGEDVTCGGLPGDNVNTEGEHVTSGGLPGDTMDDEVASHAINESEESRLCREEGKNDNYGEKNVLSKSLLLSEPDVVETGIHGSGNKAADKNINFNATGSCILQTEVLSESSDEDLEEIVYTPYSSGEIIC